MTPVKINWKPYSEARSWAIKQASMNKIESWKQWREFAILNKENLIDNKIPINPHIVYKTEWKGIGHWLGKNDLKGKRNYLKYEIAKEVVKEKQIDTISSYRNKARMMDKEIVAKYGGSLPPFPERSFNKAGWIDWFKFLDQPNIGKALWEVMEGSGKHLKYV